MMDLPRPWRRHATAALFTAVLAACASPPSQETSRQIDPEPGPAIEQTPVAETGFIASGAPIPELQDDSLFAATISALDAGDWLAASLALPQRMPVPRQEASRLIQETPVNTAAGDTDIDLWIGYFEARIALLRGATAQHAKDLAQLLGGPLPSGLEREVLWHRLQLAQSRRAALNELQIAARLLRIGGHPQTNSDALEATIWQAAQRLDEADNQQLSHNDAFLNGWLDLAAAQHIAAAPDATRAFADWQQRHPGHMATERAALLLDAAKRDAQTRHIALMLPLSGPLRAAGDAVSRGFIAAYYADSRQNLSIEILDSRRYDSISGAYNSAVEGGASVVVGPLGKRQVEALLAQDLRATPLIALNRPSSEPISAGAALLLSLAPEDEAEQLATAAFADGKRRALLIRPTGEWGDRMETALRNRWSALGGRLPAIATYTDPQSYSEAISAALGLDASAQRSRSVREVFNQSIENSGRRRADLDAVFLLARSNEDARALKPLIDYHYAGDLGVYALSTADSNSNDVALNGDLNGVRMLTMPWRLASSPLPGLTTLDSNDSFVALHALGVDAYSLARRWWRTQSDSMAIYAGQTAVLGNSPNGTLTRRLPLAEFDRGTLQPY